MGMRSCAATGCKSARFTVGTPSLLQERPERSYFLESEGTAPVRRSRAQPHGLEQ
jgi:hypothetical protein